jgi:hypothetical protein
LPADAEVELGLPLRLHEPGPPSELVIRARTR